MKRIKKHLTESAAELAAAAGPAAEAFRLGLSTDEYEKLIVQKLVPFPNDRAPGNPPARPTGTVVPHPKPIECT
jgi:hypothetical protein